MMDEIIIRAKVDFVEYNEKEIPFLFREEKCRNENVITEMNMIQY